MRSRNLFATVAIALFLPLAASALTVDDLTVQLQAVLAKITALKQAVLDSATPVPMPTATPTSAPLCFSAKRTLMRGMSGSDVSSLQHFLVTDGYLLSDNASGFFGATTEESVKNWQVSNHIVSSGTATSTGWGAVGPKTRAAILAVCNPETSNPGSWATNGPPRTVAPPKATATSTLPSATVGAVATECKPISTPASSCATSWQSVRGSDGCISSWQCASFSPTAASNVRNKPPGIEGVSGSTSLTTGETGTWSILASDPEGDSLSYSMVWGDANSAFSQILDIAGTFSSNPNFSHAYANPGIYTMNASVQDKMGNSAVAPFTVSVLAAAVASSTPANASGSGTSSTGIGTYWCALGTVGYWSQTPCATSSANSSQAPNPLDAFTNATCFWNTAQYPYGATRYSGGVTLMCAGGGWIPSTVGGAAGQGTYTCVGYGGITYLSEIPCNSSVNPNSGASTLSCPIGQCLKSAGISGTSCGSCDNNSTQ